VEACPEKATLFGSREELMREAHHRIEKNPERYIQTVVGETEVGGSSVIYVSDISLGFLSYKPDLGNQPLPDLTWAALSKVPAIAIGMGGLVTGIYWIIERRRRLSEAALPRAASEEEKDGDQ
jgi:formate dehydrogenase iron-sulfur subunit